MRIDVGPFNTIETIEQHKDDVFNELHGNKQLDTCVENIFQMCENSYFYSRQLNSNNIVAFHSPQMIYQVILQFKMVP
jgi:hypothetical protein